MSVPRGSIERQKEEEEKNGNEEAEDQGETESDDDEADERDGVDLEENRRKRVMIRVGRGEGRGVSSSTAASSSSSSSSSSLCCQADECGLDLKLAKPYHKRHKVCERHANAAVVLVNGLRQRFCQQCSRFHEISEFDGTKKSCRERLAGHNLRRRKAHSDSQERLDRNNQRSD